MGGRHNHRMNPHAQIGGHTRFEVLIPIDLRRIILTSYVNTIDKRQGYGYNNLRPQASQNL